MSTNRYSHSTTYQGSKCWPYYSANVATIIPTVKLSLRSSFESTNVWTIITAVRSTLCISYNATYRCSIEVSIFTAQRVPFNAAILTADSKSNSSTYFKPKYATNFWSHEVTNWPTK